MATTKVIDIVQRTEAILNDVGGVRWPRTEIQNWINDAYREILLYRPDANSQTAVATLAPGARQKLYDPASINIPGAISVLDVIRNAAATSGKRAIHIVERRILDTQIPGWASGSPSVDVVHWMFDIRTPKEFLVYPPAAAGAQVELAYSSVPAAHALSEAQLDPLGADATTINIDDIYVNAMVDYVMYRALLKDSEVSVNAARAAGHLGAFNASLGVKTTVDVAVAPSSNQIKRG